jgi:hypothetical protein
MKVQYEFVGAALNAGLVMDQPQSMEFMLFSMGGFGPSGFAIPGEGDVVRAKPYNAAVSDFVCVRRIFDVAAELIILQLDFV